MMTVEDILIQIQELLDSDYSPTVKLSELQRLIDQKQEMIDKGESIVGLEDWLDGVE